MKYSIKSSYEKTCILLFFALLFLLLNAFPSQAATETIQYNYDNAQQLLQVTYDDATEVDYVFDNLGNRMLKTITLAGAPANTDPNAVSNPSIPDGTIDVVSTNPTLSWTGNGDPDAEDQTVYYLFFGDSTTPPLVTSGTITTFETGQLKSLTTYYWYVITRDNHNAYTAGPLWSFTTNNIPPVAEFTSDITEGRVPLTVGFDDLSSDIDDSVADWEWDFDNDGTIDSYEKNPTYTYPATGTYTVSLTAIDMHGAGTTETKTDYMFVYEDTDGDGIYNVLDNCPDNRNPDQADIDGDGDGDACDTDMDDDGYPNETDVCPAVSDPDQLDADADGYGDACTVYHCAANSTQLKNALDTAKENGINDIVRVVQGTYGVSGINNQSFTYSAYENKGLFILGGYTAGCATREIDPANTVIDGEGMTRVFDIKTYEYSFYNKYKFEGLTITNGIGGISINIPDGIILLNRNLITGNTLANEAGGLSVKTGEGKIIISNNIITDNTATYYGGGIYAYASGYEGVIRIINNTIVGNEAIVTWGFAGGLQLVLVKDSSSAEIYNNIFRDNTAAKGGEIYIQNLQGSTINAFNNNIGPEDIYGEFTTEGNNINIDPQFTDPAVGDYHLASGSPCIDTGSTTAPSFPEEDYDGDLRTLGLKPDMGADEFYTLGTTYSISGRITESSVGLGSVEVVLSGAASATRVTDDNGGYSFGWTGDGAYTVTPVSDLYGFTPVDIPVTLSGADITGQDFTAAPKDTDGDGLYDYEDNCPDDENPAQDDADKDGYGNECDIAGSISGTITDEVSGLGIESVEVNASGMSNQTVYTDADGNYTIEGLFNGQYIIKIQSGGYFDEYYDDTFVSQYASLVVLSPEEVVTGIDASLTPDADNDDITDSEDNCPYIYNVNQADLDNDSIGDKCDDDMDDDGFANSVDVCPAVSDPDQYDTDNDGYGDACTLSHCVTSSAELQTALTDASGNNINDIIKVAQGTYSVSDNNDKPFFYSSTKEYSLVLAGGYTVDCASKANDPTTTVLDGAGISQVLTLNSYSSSIFPHWIAVDGVTVQNGTRGIGLDSLKGSIAVRNSVLSGNDYTLSGGAIFARTSDEPITFENNIVKNNSALSQAGVYLNTQNGAMTVVNNIITGNSAQNNGGGLYVIATGAGSKLRIINNTIDGNKVESFSGAGGSIYVHMLNELSEIDIYNNILIGDTSRVITEDIYLDTAPGTVNLYNNNFDPSTLNSQYVFEGNNINVDPHFANAANGDYHLTFGSACIDAGNNSAPSLPTEDFEGDARVMATAPDMGADEFYISGLTYTVSGRITMDTEGVGGIEVALTGNASATSFTDDNGDFRFSWIGDGAYTVTPLNVLYDYTPVDMSVTVSGADVPGRDFTAAAKDTDGDGVFDHEDNCINDSNEDQADEDEDGYGDVCDLTGTISGTITNETTGLGVDDVRVFVSGPVSKFGTTDANGDYTVSGLKNGNYNLYTLGTSGYIDEYYDNATSYQTSSKVSLEPQQDIASIDFELSPDMDDDGVIDALDNCPEHPNTDQADANGDGTGNVCDDDIDGDGFNNDVDVCPLYYNPDQLDSDGDGYGDDCTYTQCVRESWELEEALSIAQSNYTDDVIKLEQGTYNAEVAFSYGSSQPYSIVIQGGYDYNCVNQTLDASNTELNGLGVRNVLSVIDVSTSASLRWVRLEGIALKDGTRGALIASDKGSIDVSDSIFEGNHSTTFGGGLHVTSTEGDITLDNNVFKNNSADKSGGEYIHSTDGAVYFTGNVVTDNYAFENGGVYLAGDNGYIEVNGNDIENNSANNHAGMYIQTSTNEMVISNNVVAGNSAKNYISGLYLNAMSGGSAIKLLNNTIVNNKVFATSGYAGGVYVQALSNTSGVDIYNNIIRENIAQASAGDIRISDNTLATINVFNNNFDPLEVSGPISTEGNNINVDPLFVDAGYWDDNGTPDDISDDFWVPGDYHLSFGSAAIDAGNNSTPSLPSEDYDGEGRLLATAPDMGADEYNLGGSTYTISGQLTLDSVAYAGIEVTLSGDASAISVTDDNGHYRFSWLVDGDYTVTPVDDLFDFQPLDISVTVSDFDMPNKDFALIEKDRDSDGVSDHIDNCLDDANVDQTDTDDDDYGDVCDNPGTISGTITDRDTGQGIEGVEVKVSGASSNSALTDANGNYTVTNLENGKHDVYTFNTSGYADEYYADEYDPLFRILLRLSPDEAITGINLALTPDSDNDGVADDLDNCPLTANSDQADMNDDGEGDYCDTDIDGDGYDNSADVCPLVSDDQTDSDSDVYGDACTNAVCVTNSAELQTALNDAKNNGIDDVIHLVQGTYSTADNNNSQFAYSSAESYNLVILGGYTSGCTTRNPDPTNTMLDGADANQVIQIIDVSMDQLRWIVVEGITVQNGTKGIFLSSSNGNVVLRDSIIKYNVSINFGGGVYATSSDGTITLDNNIIENNLANSGGGAYIKNPDGDIYLSRNIVTGNSALENGGMYVSGDNGYMEVSGNIIKSNTATWRAGMHVFSSTGEVVISNNVVTGNISDSSMAGLYLNAMSAGSVIKLVNNTIVENEVLVTSGYAGGVYVQALNELSTVEIYNNIIRRNIAQASGGDIYISTSSSGTVDAYNNNFDPAELSGVFSVKGNNIHIDPQFVDAPNGDYHLSFGSACIDAGNNSAPSLPSVDYEGDGRVLATAPDIGADEFYVGGTTYTISGQITKNSVGLGGVEVSLSGDATATNISDDGGNFRFSWLDDGNYTVTPVDGLHDFTPIDYAIVVNGADVTGQEFTAVFKDADLDGIPDHEDNCPNDYNPGDPQDDADGDGYGDICDIPGSISGTVTDEVSGEPVEGATVYAGSFNTTSAADGSYTISGLENNAYTLRAEKSPVYILEYFDNEPLSSNATPVNLEPGQTVTGIDFTLEPDTDGDGLGDLSDNCPMVANAGQEDQDTDGIGDVCDDDLDGDGYANDVDVCPMFSNPSQVDSDGDGYGDACTTTHCVTNSAELQAALNVAKTNASDDVIHLATGTYSTDDNNNARFLYLSSESYSLVIQGGYNADCSTRDIDPSNTILDGGASTQVLYLTELSSWKYLKQILVEDVTIQNGTQGIYINSNNNVVMVRDSIVKDNSSTSLTGGGIHAKSTNGTVKIERNVIENNKAGTQGGVQAFNSNGMIQVKSNTIRFNTAISSVAGIKAECDYCQVEVSGNIISGNSSAGHTGGLYLYTLDGDMTVTNNIVTGNKANTYAAGIYAYAIGGGTFELINNTIAENSVGFANGYGGGLRILTYNASFVLNLYNNIFRDNTAPLYGADIHFTPTGMINAYNNNFNPTEVYGTFTNQGNNINADPLFTSAGYWDDNGTPGDSTDDFWVNGDYHLTTGSPAIDSGDNNASSIPDEDYEGDARIVNSTVDMGADEFTAVDITVDPASHDFGIVNVGEYSEQTITVTNDGLTELLISTVVAPTAPFSIVINNCPDQTILPPSANCTIDIRYEPLTSGLHNGSLNIQSDDPDENPFNVSLSGTGNEQPIANAGGPYPDNEEGMEVCFDGVASSDPDGTIDLYEWDIDDNGIYDYSSPTDTEQCHTYNVDDTYTVRLRVTDGSGATDTATTSVTITDSSPTAEFSGYPTSGNAPLTVDYTNTSYGYDQPLTYEWDFDNDGTPDSTDMNPSYVYSEPGIYSVKLTVIDSDGSPGALTRTNYIDVCSSNIVRKIGATINYYSTIQDAYDVSVSGDTIQCQETTFTNDLNIDRNVAIDIEGGYNCYYSVVIGKTTIQGDMTISNGSVTGIENIIVDDGGIPLAPLGGGGGGLPLLPGGGGLPLLPDGDGLTLPSHPTSTPSFL